MIRKTAIRKKEVDLLEIQDSFEELGRARPFLTAKEALEKLGPSKGITGPDGKPENETARTFLKMCLQAFRRGQSDAKKKRPPVTKPPRKFSKKRS